MRLVKNREFWCCEANTVELDRFVLEEILPKVGHIYSFPELSLMALVVDRVQPTHIFEWGTNIGASSLIFRQVTESLGLKIPIHTWDLPEEVSHGQHPKENYAKLSQGLDRIYFHREDGLQGALKQLKLEQEQNPKTRPLFFVDGDHSYVSVIREITGLISAQDEFHLLAHDTFVQKPDGKGQSHESWQACPTALDSYAKEYRWLNVGFGNPGMAYVWGKGKRSRGSRFRLKWLCFLDRIEIRLEKIIYKGIRMLRAL